MPPAKKATAPRKAPQDRKPKQDKVFVVTDADGGYLFNHDGHDYVLPPGESAVAKLPGRALRDAYLDGEEGQMRLAFLMLEALDADPAALEALYDMPAPEMLEHVMAWMSVKAEEGDASLGESSASSA